MDQPQETQSEINETPAPATNGVENAEQKKENEINENTEIEMTVREKELLDTVFALESDKLALIEETRTKLTHFKKELEECRLENEKLKRRNSQIEQSLTQKEAHNLESKTKKEQDDILLKAKTLLFEKTKVCKQQENHIQVLKEQVESIKEVLAITKDMLNLRNTEIEHAQERLNNIDECRKTEKERMTLLERKLQISQDVYAKLRKEHDLQTGIYKELKKTLELKIELLTNELAKVKATTKASPAS